MSNSGRNPRVYSGSINKPIWHTVVHLCCAALLIVQMGAIADLKSSRAYAYRAVREAEVLVMEAAGVCGATEHTGHFEFSPPKVQEQ
jgi:hypothetical protein